MASNVAAATAAYSDFSVETDFARFKLIVEDKTLYVNPHALAERSPVFCKMMFGDGFMEKKEQKATIEEESHKDILTFLQCLMPCSASGIKSKPITAESFPLLVRLADKFMVEGLTAECEEFIQTIFPYSDASDQALVDMLIAATKYRLSKASLAAIMGRVATIGNLSLLAQAKVDFDWPEGQKVMAAMMAASRAHRPVAIAVNVGNHLLKCDQNGYPIVDSSSSCSTCGTFPSFLCIKCARRYCSNHMKTPVCNPSAPTVNYDFTRPSLPINIAMLQ